MFRLNSTVMALSPLGKRRGGVMDAAIASGLYGNQASVFSREVEFARCKMMQQLQ